MHSASCECLRSELDLWDIPPTQTAIEGSHWVAYKPVTTLDASMTVEFCIPGFGQEYLDPAHMGLLTKNKLVKADGTDITEEDGSDAVPVNDAHMAMWSQCDCDINQRQISHIGQGNHYRAQIEGRANMDTSAKNGHMRQRLWYDDTPGYFESLLDVNNKGVAARRARTKNSQIFELFGPLHLDICNQNHLLLNNCEVRIRLTRNKDAFTLMSTAGTEKLKVLDATLYVRKVRVSPSVLLAHAQALEKAPARYPLNRVDIKTFTITQGLRDKSIDNLFMNQLPQRVIIAFVDNRAFNGDYALNGFNFQHFNLNYLNLMIDGHSVTPQPLTPDFARGLYTEAYNTLFTGTGMHWRDTGNGISYEDYANGNTLYAFDLSPDMSASEPHWNLQRLGSVRLQIKFATPLAVPINCIVYAEFQNILEITRDRNVIVDYQV